MFLFEVLMWKSLILPQIKPQHVSAYYLRFKKNQISNKLGKIKPVIVYQVNLNSSLKF